MQSSQILGTMAHGLNKSLTALLLFRASASFDAAFMGPGCNVSNMVEGIQGGLTELFQRITMLSYSVAVAQARFPLLPTDWIGPAGWSLPYAQDLFLRIMSCPCCRGLCNLCVTSALMSGALQAPQPAGCSTDCQALC